MTMIADTLYSMLALKLRGFETQKLLGDTGDGVGGREKRRYTGQEQGGNQKGQYDQDNL